MKKNMKKIAIVLILNLLAIAVFSQEFLGVKVGGTRQECIKKFVAKGFIIQKGTTNVVTMLKGYAGNMPVELFITNTQISKKVLRFTVYLPKESSWSVLKETYNTFLSVLTSKYGEPNSSYANFVDPYYEGDGYEMSAIELDKCNYSAFWDNISIDISKYKQVRFYYENPINVALSEQENNTINRGIY